MGGGEDLGGPQAPLKPLELLLPVHFQVNTIRKEVLAVNMKEIDDTDPPKSESETLNELIVAAIKHLGDECKAAFKDRDEVIRALALRVAHLEVQRTPEMENDDPEWFS